MESRGLVAELDRRVESDAAFAAELAAAHAAYGEMRKALLSVPVASGQIAAKGHADGGVAGVGDPRHVKCAHAHLAHKLGGFANPAGEIVAETLLEAGLDCTEERCSSR